MLHVLSTRARRATTLAAAAALATVGLAAVQQPQAHAASIFGQTFTGVSPTTVAAATANQVVTLTGTNFDESQILSINLGADPNCAGLTNYIVVSTTTIVVKTPPGNASASPVVPPGCIVSPSATPETVTINEPGNAGALTSAMAPTPAIAKVTFIAPPDIATSTPVVTDNSSALAAPNTVLTPAPTEKIRVTAGAHYDFDGRIATSGLTATIGTRTLTGLTVYNVGGVAQPVGGPPAGENGNYFVATLPAGLTAASSLTLFIKALNVTKSFPASLTGISWYGGPVVTSLDITSGKAGGGTTVKITGTGFDTTPAHYDGTVADVTFCGISVGTAHVTAATATLLTVTTPNASPASGTPAGLGPTVFEGACPVKVMVGGSGAGSGTSPIVPGSYFIYLTG